ncbi:MAG: hypothetical protein LBJ17_02695 [Dysgonamonadaceae bacterium]|nr:hypothetical protein [Dysgonamonadaceae bacterium]
MRNDAGEYREREYQCEMMTANVGDGNINAKRRRRMSGTGILTRNDMGECREREYQCEMTPANIGNGNIMQNNAKKCSRR